MKTKKRAVKSGAKKQGRPPTIKQISKFEGDLYYTSLFEHLFLLASYHKSVLLGETPSAAVVDGLRAVLVTLRNTANGASVSASVSPKVLNASVDILTSVYKALANRHRTGGSIEYSIVEIKRIENALSMLFPVGRNTEERIKAFRDGLMIPIDRAIAGTLTLDLTDKEGIPSILEINFSRGPRHVARVLVNAIVTGRKDIRSLGLLLKSRVSDYRTDVDDCVVETLKKSVIRMFTANARPPEQIRYIFEGIYSEAFDAAIKAFDSSLIKAFAPPKEDLIIE